MIQHIEHLKSWTLFLSKMAFYVYTYFASVHLLTTHVTIAILARWPMYLLKLNLQRVVSCPVCVENQTLVHQKPVSTQPLFPFSMSRISFFFSPTMHPTIASPVWLLSVACPLLNRSIFLQLCGNFLFYLSLMLDDIHVDSCL